MLGKWSSVVIFYFKLRVTEVLHKRTLIAVEYFDHM